MKRLCIGPFAQILTMKGLPEKGPIPDEALDVVENGWIFLEDGYIERIEPSPGQCKQVEITGPAVAVPGLIDAHTHICYAGSRARDYAMRLKGVSYQEIALQGGGIKSTMQATRSKTEQSLAEGVLTRLSQHMRRGVTTVEVKSGYGLSVEAELKMLHAIQDAAKRHPVQVVATCLAAHTLPPEFSDSHSYLSLITEELLPQVRKNKLAKRVDIFIEKGAFGIREAEEYLAKAKEMGFRLTVHADQFTRGGSQVAARLGADSADHLEQSIEQDAKALCNAGVVGVVLPGATLGLGMPFPPARKLLDHGLCLAIASDWNPGSAPMGDLLAQAALLGAAEHLTMAETWAGLTTRAAQALGLTDRGCLLPGKRADIAVFPCTEYREILYNQGSIRPTMTWIKGELHSA